MEWKTNFGKLARERNYVKTRYCDWLIRSLVLVHFMLKRHINALLIEPFVQHQSVALFIRLRFKSLSAVYPRASAGICGCLSPGSVAVARLRRKSISLPSNISIKSNPFPRRRHSCYIFIISLVALCVSRRERSVHHLNRMIAVKWFSLFHALRLRSSATCCFPLLSRHGSLIFTRECCKHIEHRAYWK